jgi:hypothetical protein
VRNLIKKVPHTYKANEGGLEVLDFDTTKYGDGGGQHSRRGLSRFFTSSRDDKSRPDSSLVSSEDRLVIPAGSRKVALVYLAIEAWRVGLLHSKSLGEVRGRDVDEDGLQRALYRSTVAEIEHVLGPILKGRKVVVKGRLEGTGRSTLERLGAEVQELRMDDEKHYVDMTPVVFVFAAIAMAVRYISLGLDDQSLYILAGISFALMYGLRPFFSKLQRPKD